MRSLGAGLVGAASLFSLFSLAARAEAGRDREDSCAPYARVLAPGLTNERALEDTFDVLKSADPTACRRRVAAGAEPALVERLLEPTSSGVQHAVLLTCVLRVPGRAAAVGAWVVEPNGLVSDRARAICLVSLAAWPEARAIFPALQGSGEAKRAADPGGARTLLHVGVGLALYGGALAGTYASRDSSGGRAIPAAGGALSGAILGVIPALVVELESMGIPSSSERSANHHPVLWAVGALVGGTAGGYLAWRFSGAADTRVVATAVTWVLPCVVVARLPF